MRFVAGRGAVAELLAESAMDKRMAALWQRAIGKMLLAGAPWRRDWPGRRCCTVGKQLPAEKSQGTIGKNLKSTSKPHSELLVDEGEEDSILFCNFGGKM